MLINFLNELLALQNQHIKEHTYKKTDRQGISPLDHNVVFTLQMPNFNKTEGEIETNFDKWLYVIKNLCHLENIPEKLKTRIFEKLF